MKPKPKSNIRLKNRRQKLSGASDGRLTRDESMEILRRAALKFHCEKIIRLRFERWSCGVHQPIHPMRSKFPAAFAL